MSDQFVHTTDQAHRAGDAAEHAAAHGEKALYEALAAAARIIGEATHAAERRLKESLDVLQTQTHSYTENVGRHFDEGQQYVVDHVRQRPVTVTLAGLGVGLLLGLLLSHRTK